MHLHFFLTVSAATFLTSCQSIAKKNRSQGQSSMIMGLPSDMPSDLKSKITGYHLEVTPVDSSCQNATNVSRSEAWSADQKLNQSITKGCDYTLILDLGEFKDDKLERVYLSNRTGNAAGSSLLASEFEGKAAFTKTVTVSVTPEGIDAGFDKLKPGPTPPPSERPSEPQSIKITVKGGYSPDTIKLKRGLPAKLIFYRDEKSGCSAGLVIKDFGISRSLAPFQTTVVEFTPDKVGEFRMTCAMDMLDGKIIVEE